MKAVEFEQVTHRIAENQEEYETLPVYNHGDESGTVTMCFQLDEDEMKQVKKTGLVWLSVMTFNKPMQPIVGRVINPFKNPPLKKA